MKTTGYAAGSEVPVFTKTYSTIGTANFSGLRCPGDCAVLVRYATTARTPKNHPIYLFNYYHGAAYVSSAAIDQVNATQVTAMAGYAGQWVGSGFSDGATTYNRAGPNGATAVGQLVEPFITHRDLPR